MEYCLRCRYKSADKLWTKFQYPAKWYARESGQFFFLHFSHCRIEFARKPCYDEAISTVNTTNINFRSYGRLIGEIRIVLLVEQWITVGSTTPYTIYSVRRVCHIDKNQCVSKCVTHILSIIMKLHENFDAFIFGVHMTTALISFDRYFSKWMLLLMLKEWLSLYGIFHRIFWSPLALRKKNTQFSIWRNTVRKFNEKKIHWFNALEIHQ